MPLTNPNKPLCTRCEKRNGQIIYKGLCHNCYTELRQAKLAADAPLKDLGKKMAEATTADAWKKLADELAPVITAVAKGEVKASAAQAALLKEIMGRAFGKITKSQEDAAGPLGLVVLPTLDTGSLAQVCPQCLEAHAKHSA